MLFYGSLVYKGRLWLFDTRMRLLHLYQWLESSFTHILFQDRAEQATEANKQAKEGT